MSRRAIPPARPAPPARLGFAGWGALVLALGVLGWGYTRPPGPGGPPAALPADPMALLQEAPPAAGPAVAADALAGRDVPAGLTPAQWQALGAQYDGRPGGTAEKARVVEYLQYRAAVQQFAALHEDKTASPARLREAALAVDAGLAPRMARGEVGAGEALLLKTAVLQALHPDDPATREAALNAWRAGAGAGPAAAADPRVDTFRREESALLAQYRALPAAQRDPAALAQALQALRVRIFDTSAAAAPPPRPTGGP